MIVRKIEVESVLTNLSPPAGGASVNPCRGKARKPAKKGGGTHA